MINTAIDKLYYDFENDEIPFAEDERFDHSTVSEYLSFILKNGEAVENIKISDADIQKIEIDHSEFDDGSYGPFEYIKINNNRKLTIEVEECETYDDNEIAGIKFFIHDGDYEDIDSICEYINENDAILVDNMDNARYIIIPNTGINKEKKENIREFCIPMLSENAFRYKFMNTEEPYDLYDIAYEVSGFFDNLSVCEWYEKYGVGEDKMEIWKNNQWVKI